MTALYIIGLIALVLITAGITLTAISVVIGEIGWAGNLSPLSYTFLLLAVVSWSLLLWLQPFQVTLK